MDLRNIDLWKPTMSNLPLSQGIPQKGDFHRLLKEQALLKPEKPLANTINMQSQPVQVVANRSPLTVSGKTAINAYQKQSETVQPSESNISALQKYKDDQLLSNPGGDHYYLAQKKVIFDPTDQKSFFGRIKKDVSDAFGNIKNFFNNFLLGAKKHYRDENNQIQETRQKGFLGSVVDFFKDVGSAFSFGAWRPDGEKEPQGFIKRAGFFFSKMKEAIFGDLLQGVTGSVINMGEDLLFSGWNLAETIPDATIGNFKAGRQVTTAIFDNGQVVMDYLTDIIPSGEAWVRVHSPDLKNFAAPIYHNAKLPERSSHDEKWKYVRNTTFRKTIETIGSLIMDVLSFKFLGQVSLFSDDKK